MYHSHFGLDEQAFSIAVNPRYLFMSAQHKEALAHLLYGVSSGGFVMLSGEVGTGKTTIIRCLLEQLPNEADLAVVMNPSASARDLVCSICDEFGLGYAPNEMNLKVLTDKLTEFLVHNHSSNRQSIVLIDEAQLLQVATLEQVRLLTNLETNTQKLLQIILVGQPELNELLARPILRQLSQRITARYHLRPLSEQETSAYIKHRLHIAGLPHDSSPFPNNIINRIHNVSNGIPRLINVLCDRMLLGAYSKGINTVDKKTCNQAIIEVLGEHAKSKKPVQALYYFSVGALSVFLLVLAIGLVYDRTSKVTHNQVSEPIKSTENNEPQAFVAMEPTATPKTTSAVPSVQKTLAETTEPKRQAEPNYWLSSQDEALHSLLTLLSIHYEDEPPYPCWAIASQGYICQAQNATNWSEFLDFNRPAVLTITSPSKNLAYVTLVGLNEGQAWVKVGEKRVKVPLSELGALWTGEYVFIWKQPEPYDGFVKVGSKGPMVSWIAKQFAQLDHQTKPITELTFNQALKMRVIIFQRKHKLDDDGVVGLQTLLKLNEELGLEQSLTDLESTLMELN